MNRIFSEITPEIIEYSELCVKNSYIEPELYKKYQVNRGLRDLDGNGVLTGLTEISEIEAYIFEEGKKIGTEGKLFYRGVDVEAMVDGFVKEKRFGFEEVVYLLLFGDQPTQVELDNFTKVLGNYRSLPTSFVRDIIMKAPSSDMMNTLARSVLTLFSYDDNASDVSIPNVLRQSLELIALFPLLAVYGYQTYKHYHDDQSLFIHQPQPELSTAENILYILRPDSQYTELEARILDIALVLHAEHGGANIKVVEMFEDMKKTLDDWTDEKQVRQYLVDLLHKRAFDNAGLIYGMGHAIYSVSDPRANVFKGFVRSLSEEKGLHDEFELYSMVERLAPEVIGEERKIYKGVSANVDFYSGFVYSMLDLPKELFTPIFAIARIAGWSAHRLEELINAGKIIRPAYMNVSERRAYEPLDERE